MGASVARFTKMFIILALTMDFNFSVARCEDCRNCRNCTNCENCENCVDCHNCKNCRYCTSTTNCNNCESMTSCHNCNNCRNCTASTNLENCTNKTAAHNESCDDGRRGKRSAPVEEGTMNVPSRRSSTTRTTTTKPSSSSGSALSRSGNGYWISERNTWLLASQPSPQVKVISTKDKLVVRQ